jgi:hypothetical protein
MYHTASGECCRKEREKAFLDLAPRDATNAMRRQDGRLGKTARSVRRQSGGLIPLPRRGARMTGTPNKALVCPCRRNAASPVPPPKERQVARRARGAAAWALPSVALALVPKCPMCIAAYLAIGGGLGVSLSTAAHLRAALLWVCWSILALLAVRMAIRFAMRRRGGSTAVLRFIRSKRRSPAHTAAA